jgi:hypothetical protein
MKTGLDDAFFKHYNSQKNEVADITELILGQITSFISQYFYQVKYNYSAPR